MGERVVPLESVTSLWALADALKASFEGADDVPELAALGYGRSAVREVTQYRVPRNPRVSLCHDMMGGYLEDALLEGGPSFHCFSFSWWQYIDSFIYFSHHCVSPPSTC